MQVPGQSFYVPTLGGTRWANDRIVDGKKWKIGRNVKYFVGAV
jgi:hypothetical protein